MEIKLILTILQTAAVLTMRSRYKMSKPTVFPLKRKSMDSPTEKSELEECSKRAKEDVQFNGLVRTNCVTPTLATQDLEEAQECMAQMQVSDPHVDP